MFDESDALRIANKLNIKFDKFSLYDFLTGLNIELEHSKINKDTNVTNDDLELTAKISLAHLNEFNDYYNPVYGLPAFEEMLKNKNRYY